MLIQSITAAGLGLTMLLAALPGSAPSTTRYRVEAKMETTVDLSGFGQPSQQHDFSLVTWIAVTISDTTGGRIVHIAVDSMKYQGAIPQFSQATADSASGGTVHGFVDANGRVKNITARPEANAFLADIQGIAYGLFPRVKAGAKAGEGWSDTVEVTNTASGANLKSRFLINYTAVAQETVAGIGALRITAASSATIAGTQEAPGAGTVEVEGTVKGNSTSLIASDGRYLGGSSNSTSDQVLKTPMAPAPIPLKVVRAVTVTLLP